MRPTAPASRPSATRSWPKTTGSSGCTSSSSLSGALIFYAVLYRTRLVPRWLSIWGFAAAAWMLAGTVLIMLDVFSGTSDSVEAIFVIPVPLGELALALWLILKGFDDRSAFTTSHTERRTLAAESAGHQ